MKDYYLAHHGILGQKWGKRNGPPYPLEPSDHSAAEKKAGYTKSISKDSQNNASTQHHGLKLSDKQKKALVIGAAVVGTALVAYGGYKIYSTKALDVSKIGKELSNDLSYSGLDTNLQSLFKEDVVSYNHKSKEYMNEFFNSNKYYGTIAGDNNCIATAVQDVLASCGITGYKAHSPVLVGPDTTDYMFSIWRNPNLGKPAFSLTDVEKAFVGTKHYVSSSYDWSELKQELLTKYGRNAHGIIGNLRIDSVGKTSKHALAFHIENGVLRFSDNQQAHELMKKLLNQGVVKTEADAKELVFRTMMNQPINILNNTTDFSEPFKVLRLDNAIGIDFQALAEIVYK